MHNPKTDASFYLYYYVFTPRSSPRSDSNLDQRESPSTTRTRILIFHTLHSPIHFFNKASPRLLIFEFWFVFKPPNRGPIISIGLPRELNGCFPWSPRFLCTVKRPNNFWTNLKQLSKIPENGFSNSKNYRYDRLRMPPIILALEVYILTIFRA